MILPNPASVKLAQRRTGSLANLEIQAGGLPESLAQADLAIASSGTVTLECAYFGVPAVVLYRLSWAEYQIAKRLVNVKHIAMPNLLLGEPVYPELIQDAATADNIAREALSFSMTRRGATESRPVSPRRFNVLEPPAPVSARPGPL